MILGRYGYFEIEPHINWFEEREIDLEMYSIGLVERYSRYSFVEVNISDLDYIRYGEEIHKVLGDYHVLGVVGIPNILYERMGENGDGNDFSYEPEDGYMFSSQLMFRDKFRMFLDSLGYTEKLIDKRIRMNYKMPSWLEFCPRR